MATTRSARPEAPPAVRRLDGRSVTAAWGASELLMGFPDRPAGEGAGPEAEVWYGAHPRASSWVVEGDRRRPAAELDESERPPFLVKLLAAGSPLSVQVHPDDATAARGYAAEQATGRAETGARNFVDASGKPELLRALGPMRVLCGLRPARDSRTLLSVLAPEGADALLETLAHGDAGLLGAIELLLRADPVDTSVLLAAVLDGASDVIALAAVAEEDGTTPVDPGVLRLAQLAVDLQRRFPGDPATLVALLLEDVDLTPGEAIAVAPGTPHAYLSGLGVEVMALSDNVLRAGMTEKHVDVDAFLASFDASAVGVPRVGTLPRRADGAGWQRTITPTDAFVVDEANVDGSLELERGGSGPAIVLCLSGRVVVGADDGSGVEIGPGGAALISAGSGSVVVRGQGLVLHVTRIRRAEPVPTSA
jgi:mannose-6-phosphate isomerase